MGEGVKGVSRCVNCDDMDVTQRRPVCDDYGRISYPCTDNFNCDGPPGRAMTDIHGPLTHDKVNEINQACFSGDWLRYYNLCKGTTQTVVKPDHAPVNERGPSYYKGMHGVQTWDYILANDLGYLEGNIVKYITRYKQKGWRSDLLKAKAYLDKLLEITPDAKPST